MLTSRRPQAGGTGDAPISTSSTLSLLHLTTAGSFLHEACAGARNAAAASLYPRVTAAILGTMASSAKSGALVAGSGVSKVGSARCFFGRAQRQQWRRDGPQATGQSPSVS